MHRFVTKWITIHRLRLNRLMLIGIVCKPKITESLRESEIERFVKKRKNYLTKVLVLCENGNARRKARAH